MNIEEGGSIDDAKDSLAAQCQAWGWSASHFSLETLESTSHNHELEVDPNGQIHVHFDKEMMGIGGYDSWSPNVCKEHMISSGRKVEGALLLSPIIVRENRDNIAMR